MKSQRTLLLALSFLAASALAGQAQTTIYTEDFGDATENQPTTSVDWHWMYQDGANVVSPDVATMEARENPGLGGPGGFTGRVLVAWGEGSNNAWETSDTFLFFDSSPTFDTSGGGSLLWSNLDEFSFAANRGSTFAGTTRAVIQIGGTWYASEAQTFTTTVSTYTIDIQDTNWLAFTPGTSLALSGTGDTLANLNASGNLQGVGLWVNATSGTGSNRQWRVDDLEITAIPEPSTYAVIAGLLALGLVAWRRRKS